MAPPQHREHLTDRVQRLEAWAFAAGADVADIKAAVEQLPAAIRQEILDYTEPVFGEIMAGRATLATRQDLDALSLSFKFRSSHLVRVTLSGRLRSVIFSGSAAGFGALVVVGGTCVGLAGGMHEADLVA